MEDSVDLSGAHTVVDSRSKVTSFFFLSSKVIYIVVDLVHPLGEGKSTKGNQENTENVRYQNKNSS